MALTKVQSEMAGAGQVLQVVSSSNNTSFSTTSTSFVSTGLGLSITPKFATSKILILFTSAFYANTVAQACATIYRGGTELSGQANGFSPNVYSNAAAMGAPLTISYVDSPATTSSTTYTAYLRSNTGGATVYYNGASGLNTFILMEIAA